MAVDNTEVIDMITENEDGNELVLGISDHLDWENEYEHLMLLQAKINSYLMFIETKQYNETYPNRNYKSYLIRIYFAYDTPDNCQKFLDHVLNYANEQMTPSVVKIIAEVSG